jgi:AbrB family looped-hinge helix DNA binding protein
MRKQIGVIKEIDELGRLVIPKEMRQLFGFEKSVEVVVTEDGVLVRNPQYKLVKR